MLKGNGRPLSDTLTPAYVNRVVRTAGHCRMCLPDMFKKNLGEQAAAAGALGTPELGHTAPQHHTSRRTAKSHSHSGGSSRRARDGAHHHSSGGSGGGGGHHHSTRAHGYSVPNGSTAVPSASGGSGTSTFDDESVAIPIIRSRIESKTYTDQRYGSPTAKAIGSGAAVGPDMKSVSPAQSPSAAAGSGGGGGAASKRAHTVMSADEYDDFILSMGLQASLASSDQLQAAIGNSGSASGGGAATATPAASANGGSGGGGGSGSGSGSGANASPRAGSPFAADVAYYDAYSDDETGSIRSGNGSGQNSGYNSDGGSNGVAAADDFEFVDHDATAEPATGPYRPVGAPTTGSGSASATTTVSAAPVVSGQSVTAPSANGSGAPPVPPPIRTRTLSR